MPNLFPPALLFIALTAFFTRSLSAPAALASDPVYVNDEGGLVDDRGPTRKVSFEDGDTLEGEVLSLDGTVLRNNRGRHHASLISIRGHFVDHLIKLSWDAPFF